MDERPSWTWLTDAHEAIAADVHHRHGLDWYTMPTAPGFRLAMLLLQTPGTYTHSSVLTAQLTEPTKAPTAEPPAPRRAGGPGAIRASEGEHTTAAAAPMSDRWRALADMNGVPSG